MIEVAYVGSRGHDLISARDANQPPPARRAFQPAAQPAVRRHHAHRVARLVALQRAAAQVLSSARSAGLSLLAAYTFGKSTDDASGFFTSAGDPNFPQNSLDPGAEEGRSSFDVRHRFSAGFVLCAAVRRGTRWLSRTGELSQGSCTHFDERPARSPSRCIPTSTAATPAARTSGSATTIGPNVTGDARARRSRPPETSGSTPRRSRCPHSARFGNARPQHAWRARLQERQPRRS